jgi:transposase InsO family protein
VNVFPFIEAERAQQRSVKRACELLEVSRAAYYAHRAGTVSSRQRTDKELTERIHHAHQASKGRYGAPRIHAQLRRQGHRHGRKRVARLMRAAGLHGRTPRRFKRTTIPDGCSSSVGTAAIRLRGHRCPGRVGCGHAGSRGRGGSASSGRSRRWW